MNQVNLIGRLTKDPDVKYTSETQMAIARFHIAIDRGKDKNGESKGADFPSILCFGKTAEHVERYLEKGRLVGIIGRIQTGKYEKDGKVIYNTDIVADRVQFLDFGDEKDSSKTKGSSKEASDVPEGFGALTDEDIPF